MEVLVNFNEPMAKILNELGWVALTERIYIKTETGEALVLTDALLEFVDLVYMSGCRFGMQRAMYEMETLEDVEAEDIEVMNEIRKRILAEKTSS